MSIEEARTPDAVQLSVVPYVKVGTSSQVLQAVGILPRIVVVRTLVDRVAPAVLEIQLEGPSELMLNFRQKRAIARVRIVGVKRKRLNQRIGRTVEPIEIGSYRIMQTLTALIA